MRRLVARINKVKGSNVVVGALPLLQFHRDVALDSSLIVCKRFPKLLSTTNNLLMSIDEWERRVCPYQLSSIISALTDSGMASKVIELGAPFSPLRELFSYSLAWELICHLKLLETGNLFTEAESSPRRSFTLSQRFDGSTSADLVILNLNHSIRYGVFYDLAQLLEAVNSSSQILIIARVTLEDSGEFLSVNGDEIYLESKEKTLSLLAAQGPWSYDLIEGFDEGFLMETPVSSSEGNVECLLGNSNSRTGLLLAVKSNQDLTKIGLNRLR